MSLTVDDITRIARQAAGAASPTLEVAGITLGGGADSDYIEILVNIRNCHRAPCRIEIGAFRDVGETALQDELERKLRDHVAARQTSQ